MSKLAVFQACDHLLYFVMGKSDGVFFEDSLVCFYRWRVKKNDCYNVLSKRLSNAGELLCHTHTLMPAWRAEKPSLTSSPVRPFTSFEGAQSSRTVRVFSPSKQKLAYFSHISTRCCSQMLTYKRESLSANKYSVLL